MLLLLAVLVPGSLLVAMILFSLGSGHAGSPESKVKRPGVRYDDFMNADDEIGELHELVGPLKPKDRHVAMPTAKPGQGSLAWLDDVEMEEFVALTNAKRERDGLEPLSAEEIRRRHEQR